MFLLAIARPKLLFLQLLFHCVLIAHERLESAKAIVNVQLLLGVGEFVNYVTALNHIGGELGWGMLKSVGGIHPTHVT